MQRLYCEHRGLNSQPVNRLTFSVETTASDPGDSTKEPSHIYFFAPIPVWLRVSIRPYWWGLRGIVTMPVRVSHGAPRLLRTVRGTQHFGFDSRNFPASRIRWGSSVPTVVG